MNEQESYNLQRIPIFHESLGKNKDSETQQPKHHRESLGFTRVLLISDS